MRRLAGKTATLSRQTCERENGGGRGIRTPEPLAGLTVFKTAGFNRSPIPPVLLFNYIQRASCLFNSHCGDFCRDPERFSCIANTCSVLKRSNLSTASRLCSGVG